LDEGAQRMPLANAVLCAGASHVEQTCGDLQ